MFASACSSALNVSHHVVGNSGGRLCRVFASAWSASVAWRSPYVSYRTSHAPVSSTGSAMALMRSEEHTSELQSLMSITYAVFCLKQKTQNRYLYTISET